MRRRMVPFTLLLACLSVCCSTARGQTESDSPVETARSALRVHDFARVDQILAQPEGPEGWYLRALARHLSDRHEAAIADAIEAESAGEAPWLRRARFLRAACATALRRHEEAAHIYEEEAARLLSGDRKAEMADVYVRIAEELSLLPAPGDLDAPKPDYGKAATFYERALELELPHALRAEFEFRRARMVQLQGDAPRAADFYRKLLESWDPAWREMLSLGPLPEDLPAMDPPRRLLVRYFLALAEMARGDARAARNLAEEAADSGDGELAARALLLVAQSHGFPESPDADAWAAAARAARSFLERFPEHREAVETAFRIAKADMHVQRSEEAVRDLESFLATEGFRLTDTVETRPESLLLALSTPRDKPISSRARYPELAHEARFLLGDVHLSRKEYDEARSAWSRYLADYPNGPRWADAQQRILEARYLEGLDRVADEDYDAARTVWDAFLTEHPLDGRAQRIMYVYGRIDYQKAVDAEEALEDAGEGTPAQAEESAGRVRLLWEKTVATWEQLVAKYPGSEESSLAQWEIGRIYEEKLGRLDDALAAYRKLDWGSRADRARTRVDEMTRKSLEVITPHTFRSDETPGVDLKTRNVEKVTARLYHLDLEEFFRKTHGITDINALDLPLIDPDEEWEVEIAGYAQFLPATTRVDLPVKGPGVWAVSVGDDDMEATALVVCSDLDIIAKASRKQVLVFTQDMRRGAALEGTEVFVSDSARVILEGVANADGVYIDGHDRLKEVPNIRVFARQGDHVAAAFVNLDGLGVSRGLTPRGYVYTDRPAYLPGAEVGIKAVLRTVEGESYAVEPGVEYTLSVTTPNGRLLTSETVTVNDFGTIIARVELPDVAPSGDYTIRLTAEDRPTFSGSFRVERYELQKVRLELELDRTVYFAGDPINASFRASTYDGRPVPRSPVRYVLPDGRQLVKETDDQGVLEVSFATKGRSPGEVLVFQGFLEEEGVRAAKAVLLATQGFGLSIEKIRPIVVAGEGVEAQIKAADPEGKPVDRKVKVSLVHRERRKANPILASLPWQETAPVDWAEVVVETREAKTGEEGAVTVRFAPEAGGDHWVRVEGEDRLGQTVSAARSFFVSDDEDRMRLRLFADAEQLEVGAHAEVDLLWREEAGLALLTYEGEDVLGYEVVALGTGSTPFRFTPEHKHFPNFTLAVAVMQGRKLHAAAVPFTVRRELVVEIRPADDVVAPGAEGTVTLVARDQLDNPVEAELSIALVQRALFDLFPDPIAPIGAYFQEGIHREAALRTIASNGFEYRAVSVPVVDEVLEERFRLEDAKRVQAGYSVVVAGDAALAAGRPLDALRTNGEFIGMESRAQAGALQLVLARDAPALPASVAEPVMTELTALGHFYADAAGRALGDTLVMDLNGDLDAGAHFAFGGGGVRFAASRSRSSVRGVAAGRAGEAAPAGPRRELPGAGVWVACVATHPDGTAEVKIPFPEETTSWRLVARGCSVETLVGQATADVETRREVFVEVQVPPIAGEGDSLRLPLVVHNLGDEDLRATARLLVLAGDDEIARFSGDVKVTARGRERLVMDVVRIPAVPRLTVRAELAQGTQTLDTVELVVPVRAWGMERTVYKAGSAAENRTVALDLDPALTGTARMKIEIGERARSAIIDAALGRWVGLRESMCRPLDSQARLANDLLACSAALEYVTQTRALGSDVEELRSRCRSLVAALSAAQRDDGHWSWTGAPGGGNGQAGITEITARAVWALSAASQQGIKVDPEMLARGRNALLERFRAASALQRDPKAMILWALAVSGETDFAYANRLYRERGQLSAEGLAYTALSLARLERVEMAREVVDLLAQALPPGGETALLEIARRADSPWAVAGPVETTALAALAVAAVEPAHPELRRLIAGLEATRTDALPEGHGPAVAALAAYYGTAERAEADFTLTIYVNDTEVARHAVTGASVPGLVEVPSELLRRGENRVRFAYDGRGAYAFAVAVSGWSTSFPEDRPWGDPFPTRRRIYHAPLRYRGRAMHSSSQEVGQIRVGEVAHVTVEFDHDADWRPFVLREPIPAGCQLVPGTVDAGQDHLEVLDGELILTFRPQRQLHTFSYDIVGRVPGSYRAAPSVLMDAMDPSQLACGTESLLEVLAPGEEPGYEYRMNCGELWAFSEATFNDNRFEESLRYLKELRGRCPDGYVPDKERLLVWILSRPEFYDADGLVDAFEVLKERQPDLWVPFEKMEQVGQAYLDKGETERAALVYRAVLEASFYRDARAGGALREEGRFLASIDYVDQLVNEYPPLAPVVEAEFGLGQLLHQKSEDPDSLKDEARRRAEASGEELKAPTRQDLLIAAVERLRDFRTLHPASPLGDDAAFSEANALLDLRRHEAMIDLVRLSRRLYPPEANYAADFPYMEALGLFHRRDFEDAVAAAEEVAESKNENRDFAVYILGQIYHTQDKPGRAVEFYRRVADKYPDAAGSLEYFERKTLEVPEVTSLKPGEPVELKIHSRNLTGANVLVYRVDLMTLYLREKELSRIAEVNLAGIEPQASLELALAREIDYRDHETVAGLPLEKEGAYLVLVRAGDLFASGMVLVTPLDLEVQEDTETGTVRANVRRDGAYAEDVHVKIVGSGDGEVRSGDTDLRGVVAADGIRGQATVIARDEERRYAFHRGDIWLGPPEPPEAATPAEEDAAIAQGQLLGTDLGANLKQRVQQQWELNDDNFTALFDNTVKGVQVQMAY